MGLYTVRVELHSDQYNPDFEILHRAMQNEGFSKLIKSSEGKTYYLPRGEYTILTNKNRLQVLNVVEKAVAETKETAEILVTEAIGRNWSGLAEKK